MKKKIVYVVGTRPEFIRSAFIIKKLKQDPEINFHLVHTGQHYSHNMDKVFFPELGLPKPDINLEVGSASHAKQTAEIMEKFEDYLLDYKPDVVAVFGDTNSTLAAALTAVKLKIKTAHLEAGCREWEMDIPEEINRITVDHICNLLLPVSLASYNNLIAENVRGKIIHIGDPLYDVYNFYSQRLKKRGNSTDPYLLLTLHRDKNTDNLQILKGILHIINKQSPHQVIYPCHPRTMVNLKRNKVNLAAYTNIKFIDPVGYQKMLELIRDSELLITDSGGLQKEAYWSKKICITVRSHTAWDETVKMGVNFLTTHNLKRIENTIIKILKNRSHYETKFRNLKNPYYKKGSLDRIIQSLKSLSEQNRQ